MQTAPPASFPRRRRWPAVLACVLALAAAPPGYWFYHHWSARRELERLLAEMDRADPGWRFAEIQARRKVLPPERNSAEQILRVLRVHGRRYFDFPESEAKRFEGLAPQAQLTGRQRAVLRGWLDKADRELAEAYKLRDLPEGRHPIVYTEAVIDTLVETMQQARNVAYLLHYDALRHLQDGDEAKALDASRCQLNVARSIGDEPCLVGMLIRVACTEMALRTLERALAQGEPGPAALEEMQGRLERELGEPLLTVSLRGTRASIHAAIAALHAGKIKPALFRQMSDGAPPPGPLRAFLERFIPGTLAVDEAACLRALNRVVAAAELPEERQQQAVTEALREAKEQEVASAGLLKNLGLPVAAHHRGRAGLRCAVAGLAAERYRLKHGRWPESLAELVKGGMLREVPRDPFDGQPLRLRRLPDGLVIYSIGPDQADDRGRTLLRHQSPAAPQADVGFRLWDVDARRQLPHPPE